MSARLDSGAEAIILRESTVNENHFPVTRGQETTIIFGNGDTALSRERTQIGELEALVCEDKDLNEDLVSINPLLDIGFKLTMESSCGKLSNEETGHVIHVRREGPRWSIDLEDLAKVTSDMPDMESHAAQLVQANSVLNTDPSSIKEKVILLHERLGHAHSEAMCSAISGESPAWTHCDLSPAQIRRVMKRYKCLICHLAKRPRPPIAAPSGDRKDIPPGFCVSGDIVPVSPPAYDGSTMFFLFADVRTGYMIAYTGKAKNSFLDAFKSLVEDFKRWGHHVKAFRSDAETVLKDGKMGQYLNDNGFIHELSTPEAHYQNFVERYVLTITTFTSALLHGQDILQSKHWHWALFHAVACRNRTPNVKCSPSTPYEIITGMKVNLTKTFQFVFGDLVAVHMPKDKRSWKFDLRWDVGVYIGQPEFSVEAALVYFPYKGQVLVRTDVARLDITDEAYRRYYSKRFDMHGNSKSTSTRIHQRLDEVQWDFSSPLDHDVNELSQQEATTTTLAEPEEIPAILRDKNRTRRRRNWNHLPTPINTRSRGNLHVMSCRITYSDNVHVYTVSIKAYIARSGGPTVREALESSLRDQWINEMRREIIDSMLNTTGTLRPEVIDKSKPYHFIHTTMQLKIKMITETIVDKLKARLCACGNELDQVDHETYSPTVSSLTHSLMLQIAVHDRMHIQMIDTKAAYLCQSYPEDATPLYVVFPKLVAEALNLDPKQTYRVQKYIYGLPDAGRAYYDAYSDHLISHGYNRTASDPCLFFKILGNRRRVYIWIHVDDTLIAADDLRDIDEFKEVMQKRFEITVNEEADHHLGVNIQHLEDGSLKLTQSKLLSNIFKEHEEALQNIRVRNSVPLNPNTSSTDDTPFDRRKYLHLLGMLNYLLRSRPDISTALSYMATKSVNPTHDDYHSLLDIVRYLWITRDVGLIIRPGSRDEPLRLKCYVDASFLSHEDSRGHTGYCIALGDLSAFYSKSSKQQLVATSSTHAEVKALYQCVVDLIYIINLCDEIKRSIELPAIIFEDNNPTVQVSNSFSSRIKRSKHFLMLINFIRYNVTLGLIEVQKVGTSENIADVLTKLLPWSEFAPKAARLLGIDVADFFSNSIHPRHSNEV